LGSTAFIAPTGPHTTEISHEVSRAGVAHDVSIDTPATTGWTATATVGAAVGVMSASALARRRARPEMSNQVEAGTSSSVVSTPVGKGGFVGATNGDFLQTDYSNSVDAALTMVMGEDLVKVVMWYDNEWGYSQRVIDLTAIVAAKMPVAA